MSVQCETTTNMTKEFLSMIQKMIEVWRKSMGCEEQPYHEIDTQSRLKHSWFDLQLELYKRKKNDKVIQANLPKNVWIWKYAFHLSVMKIWASSRKSNRRSNKEWGTKPVIGGQCKKVIMNISQSIEWVITKWRGVSSQEMRMKDLGRKHAKLLD